MLIAWQMKWKDVPFVDADLSELVMCLVREVDKSRARALKMILMRG